MRCGIRRKVIYFMSGLIFIVIYCEFFIYYITVFQCSWPTLQMNTSKGYLKVFILSDIHLLGPKGHWLDKWRRETQMHRAFQSIIAVRQPHAVFILGDLFDEGESTSDDVFNNYVRHFKKLFKVPNSTDMYVVVGNHDIGFHNYIRRGDAERFEKLLRAPSVNFFTLRGNHFVLINSMAMHGDNCGLCTDARGAINNISEILECFRVKKCSSNQSLSQSGTKYSRPILMQHFPLYRKSDANCTESDAAPLSERYVRFHKKIHCLSPESTEYLVNKIKPRVVFGGHTHHGCVVNHNIEGAESFQFTEHSLPSFSWRNRADPKYILATITPDEIAVQKCALPKESSIIITGICLLAVLVYSIFLMKPYKKY